MHHQQPRLARRPCTDHKIGITRPSGCESFTISRWNLPRVAAIGIHHEDLFASTSIAVEGDARAIGRPRRVLVIRWIVRKILNLSGTQILHEDIHLPGTLARKD